MVTAHNFDAVLAQRYFIICVPTVYERMFPRLISCPDQEVSREGKVVCFSILKYFQHFDPNHIDGCVGSGHAEEAAPPPPPPPPAPPVAQSSRLPPPVFGSPEPLITHIGTPLPPGSSRGFSAGVKKRSPHQQPAIEISADSKDNQTHVVWPS